MKLPEKYMNSILKEAHKNACFKWYKGWEKSSGYIASELLGDRVYNKVRIYIKWEKKKEPTQKQIEEEVTNYINSLLEKKEHPDSQRSFRAYIVDKFFVDINRLKHEAMNQIQDNIIQLCNIIEKSDQFTEPNIQELFNDLKNLEAGLLDEGALKHLL